MFTHDVVSRLRRSLLLFSVVCSIVLGAAAVSPASADTPKAWEKAPDVSPLGFLLVVAIIPLGIAAVLALLTILPSMASDRGYEPGQSWRTEPQWFGGPAKGVEAATDATPEQVESRTQGTGGTSANW